MPKLKSALLLVVLLMVGEAAAQQILIPNPIPHMEWRVSETDHFRVYYPAEYEDWALHVVAMMNSIHEEVTAMIGYGQSNEKVDVVVMDPLSVANGMAIPFLDKPRIVLWPVTPGPEDFLGEASDFAELVVTHEYGHHVHLTRKPRSSVDKLISFFIPVGPVARKAPNWVIEGYAVILESRITRTGRSQSNYRAALVRQWAREGKLPSYTQLQGDESWAGRRNPYYFGSAFLEWLEARSGNPDAFTDLWKRMSAKKTRSFDEAFKGVFQDSPEDLYGRFSAEMTAEALRIEKQVSPEVMGELWQEGEGRTGPPDVSPDGKMLAVTVNPKHKVMKLKVYSTSELEDEEDQDLDDPEDVPDKPWAPPRKKELYSFTERGGIRPEVPRWTSDSRSLIFHSFMRQGSGEFRPDLYQWTPSTGALKRLSFGANLRWADPIPNQNAVVAVRQAFGKNSLVVYDWEANTIDFLTEPSVEVSWETPRVSPNGQNIVALKKGKNTNALMLINLKKRKYREILPAEGELFANPVWALDGKSILLAVDRNGIFNIEKLDVETGARQVLTNTVEDALFPVAGPKNSVFYLSLQSRGWDIRYLEDPVPVEPAETEIEGAFPVMPPPRVEKGAEFEVKPTSPGTPYGLGKQEFGLTGSGYLSPAGHLIELGAIGGDLLGRLNYLVMGGWGFSGAPKGGLVQADFRGLPVGLSLGGYFNRERPSEQKKTSPLALALDRDDAGIVMGINWEWYGTTWKFRVGIDGVGSWVRMLGYDIPAEGTSSESAEDRFGLNALDAWGFRGLAQSYADLSSTHSYGLFRIRWETNGKFTVGRTGDTDWTQYLVRGRLKMSYDWFYLSSSYSYGDTNNDPTALDNFRIGGSGGSIQPNPVLGNQISIPYLASAARWGTNVRHAHAEIGNDGLINVVAFGDRLESRSGRELQSPLDAVGAELRLSLSPIYLLLYSAMEMRLGLAYGFDDPIDNKMKGYFTFLVHL
jgi:hypothetical protein